uniref:Synergin gamma C-terminal domain-containing protein n=1 Tax=Leersia perrieri TaxID=77586 RepID=A0A0D9XP24_9ORYZ
MDAVAFPPPPAPFLDDADFDFGDFAFAPPATDPHPPPATFAAFDDDWGDPHPAAAAFDDDWGDFVDSRLGSSPDGESATPAEKPSSWEKPRGPLPLSLFGADDEEDEGPTESPPPPTATATDTVQQGVTHAASNGSKPGDLKDLIAGLYGSQPLSSSLDAVEVGTQEEEDGDGFGDDGWEFKAAPSSSDAGQDGGGQRTHGDIIEDIQKSMGSHQEDWSLFTGVDENLNHLQSTDHVGTRESTVQSVKALSYFPPNNAAILDLYKESEMIDAVHMMQSSSESVQSSSDMFSSTEMNSSFETDESHSIKSASDRILIDFYHRLRKESLTVISQYNEDFKEICEKLQDSLLTKDFCKDEQPSKDVCISELLNSAKEDHLKEFDQEYRLTETIAMALEDMSSAVELYKHSVSTLRTLELASKEEQYDYVRAWYSMLLCCAQELQHGAMLWQESCRANVDDTVISQGAHCFIALGEIYRVAQILHLSLQSFKPWVLADPGMLSKMLVCWNNCINSWTSGLGTALALVVDSSNSDAPVATVLLQSIINIDEIEVANLQSSPPSDRMTCKLTLLPTSLVPGMEVVIWDGDHYFVKVANLWANRISSNSPQFSATRVA